MKVNVSSVNDFMQCRFRWWAKWVMNRVPVATAPALDGGKLLHLIFEDAFKGQNIQSAARTRCGEYRKLIGTAHPASRIGAMEAAEQIEDLIEALPLWQDKFKITKVLEVEQAFEWPDPVIPGLIWVGRPDRRVLASGRTWHVQNRGLAAGMNFGTYCRLRKRDYHEHLYAEEAAFKYLKWPVGGSVFNLVRKLKYRTNVGKKNEKTKTAEEMFYQQAMAINLKSPLHKSVMQSLRGHVLEMNRVRHEWEAEGIVPSPNEKQNGGYGGNSEDPYFKVLIGEITLNDPDYFKEREDLYA